jgi:hypothetical protein
VLRLLRIRSALLARRHAPFEPVAVAHCHLLDAVPGNPGGDAGDVVRDLHMDHFEIVHFNPPRKAGTLVCRSRWNHGPLKPW